jgi:hypothetical protein
MNHAASKSYLPENHTDYIYALPIPSNPGASTLSQKRLRCPRLAGQGNLELWKNET